MIITEDLVSFELAKLAKERGFDIDHLFFYESDGHLNKFSVNSDNSLRGFSTRDGTHIIISAPTLYSLLKWIREKHNLIVIVGYVWEFDSTPFTYYIYSKGKSSPMSEWLEDFETYEEALEAGIYKALELI